MRKIVELRGLVVPVVCRRVVVRAMPHQDSLGRGTGVRFVLREFSGVLKMLVNVYQQCLGTVEKAKGRASGPWARMYTCGEARRHGKKFADKRKQLDV